MSKAEEEGPGLKYISSYVEFQSYKKKIIEYATIDIKRDKEFVVLRVQNTSAMPNLMLYAETIQKIYMKHQVEAMNLNEVCNLQIAFFNIESLNALEISFDISWKPTMNPNKSPIMNIFLVVYNQQVIPPCSNLECSCCGMTFDYLNLPRLPDVIKHITLSAKKINMVNLLNIFVKLCQQFPDHLTGVNLGPALLLKGYAKRYLDKEIIYRFVSNLQQQKNEKNNEKKK